MHHFPLFISHENASRRAVRPTILLNRNHIHFAAGEPGDQGVISGMRSSAQVFIHVDVEKAMSEGIKFYKSANNVILSPGDAGGVILPQYFKSVKNMKNNQELLESAC